jgi:hypothetical protein
MVPAFAVVLIATSCSLGDPTDAGSINIYLDVNDVQLTVGLDTITFTVTARNVGNDPLSFTGPSDCLLYVEVLSSIGNMVWSSNIGCAGQTVTEELAAAQDKVMTIRWDGRTVAGSFLDPGLYVVRPVARTTPTATIGPPVTIALD